MNNFTKEELQTLFHWGVDRVQAIGTELFEEESGDKLYEKLRIMIEDYCDHEWIYDVHRGRKVCSKCGLSVWS